MIKLDVNNGVYTMDMRIFVDQEVQFSAANFSFVDHPDHFRTVFEYVEFG